MPHAVPLGDGQEGARGSARPDLITLAAFAGTALFGGGNAVAIRLGYAELAPFWGAAVRFLAAALMLLGVCGWRCQEAAR